MRKPVFALCKQQRHRSACASAQSDQHLCCLLLRLHDILPSSNPWTNLKNVWMAKLLSPTYFIGWLKMSEIILTGRKAQIGNEKENLEGSLTAPPPTAPPSAPHHNDPSTGSTWTWGLLNCWSSRLTHGLNIRISMSILPLIQEEQLSFTGKEYALSTGKLPRRLAQKQCG